MRKLLFLLACISALGIILFSLVQIADKLRADQIQTRTFYELAALVEASAIWAENPPAAQSTPAESGSEREILPAYQALYALNSDFAGWLRLEGTALNHPVMHTPDNPERYLYRDFYGGYSAHGTPFIGAGSSPESENIIIYGHRMKGGQVFGALAAYERAAFYEAHPFIRFDTLYESHTYEIICVFKTQVYTPDAFAYYAFDNSGDKAAFDAFLAQCSALALYPVSASASHGDRLLTLSTCDYEKKNNRLVILARQIDAG